MLSSDVQPRPLVTGSQRPLPTALPRALCPRRASPLPEGRTHPGSRAPLPACPVPHDPRQSSAGLAWPGLRASPRDRSETRGWPCPAHAQDGQNGEPATGRAALSPRVTQEKPSAGVCQEPGRDAAAGDAGGLPSGNVLEPRGTHGRRHQWFIVVEKRTGGWGAPCTLTSGRGSRVNLSSPTWAWAGAGTAPPRCDGTPQGGGGAPHEAQELHQPSESRVPGQGCGNNARFLSLLCHADASGRSRAQVIPGATGQAALSPPACKHAASSSGVSSDRLQPSCLSFFSREKYV